MRNTGVMKISVLKALLDRISRFSLSSSCDSVNSEPVQKYYRKINEMLKLLHPVIDQIVESEVASDEQLNKLLAELDTIVCEASELVESWHKMMSKVYFVMQMDSLIAKMQTSELELCQLLNSLLQDYGDDSNSSECIEHCIQKISLIGYGQISNVIKEAIRNLMENTLPSSERLVMIADSLSLSSNQELLMEAVALDKVKSKTEHDENNEEAESINHMIALVTHMHNCLVKIKQSQIVNGTPIPADFCCPLSLELMSDPVIVSSGQTYERAFIRKWLDLGLNVCPKTRQTLGHTNLIPNYTVKALIANWCEVNNVKLPDPLKSMTLNQPSALLTDADRGARNSHTSHASRTNRSRSPEPTRSASQRSLFSSNGTHPDAHLNDEPTSPPLRTDAEGALVSGLISGSPLHVGNGFEVAGISRISSLSSEDRELNLEEITVGSSEKALMPSSMVDEECQVINRSASVSSAVSSTNYLRVGNANEIVSSDLTHYNSGASGDVTSDASASSSPRGDSTFPSRLAEARPRSQTIWRRPSERFVPRIVSSPASDTSPDLSVFETQVHRLVEELQSPLINVQKLAASELRFLAKHSTENRIVIANCGAINFLVGLLNSTDIEIQENAVTALLNLSINDNNKTAIVDADAIYPLIHVLETGSPEAKENSAATLFSLSVLEENKVLIGRSGAIRPLVDLLANGTPRGKRDAATALFNLSIFHENKAQIVQAGAVKCLVELMDPAAGMVDKAVAVLSNLATIPEGRTAIGQARGIPVLVEVVELGSSRGKENAAAALLQLCTNNNRFCNMVLQEGSVPPLVALSQSGTPRAKEKAQTLLNYFRNQRHNNGGRG